MLSLSGFGISMMSKSASLGVDVKYYKVLNDVGLGYICIDTIISPKDIDESVSMWL